MAVTTLSAWRPSDAQNGLDTGEIERNLGGNDDPLCPGGRELLNVIKIDWAVDEHAALDARLVPADFLAPLVKHAVLVREHRHRPEPGPDVGVLRGRAEGDSFPFAADHQRQPPDRRGVEFGAPRLFPDHAPLARRGPGTAPARLGP